MSLRVLNLYDVFDGDQSLFLQAGHLMRISQLNDHEELLLQRLVSDEPDHHLILLLSDEVFDYLCS